MDKLEKGDLCIITDADITKVNIGTHVHLIRFIPCMRDGNSKHETSFYVFDNNADDAAWIVAHATPPCELEYVTSTGETDFGELALVKCSHLKLVRKFPPPTNPPPKPIIQCG